MDTETISEIRLWALQGGILLFCAFIQSTVGFAFTLFSNSLLLLAGMPLPETVMLSTLGSILQRLAMTARMYRHVNWRETLPISGVCLLTLPFGILILKLFSRQSIGVAKVSLGVFILIVLALQIFWKVKPREKLHRGWGILAASVSGLLTGLANIGGPPLLLWVHAHDWPNGKTRMTIIAITTILMPAQMVLMLAAFGPSVFPAPLQMLALAPFILAGSAAGMEAGHRLSSRRLRVLALSLLALTSLVSILGPLLGR
jgi:uncharacterized membrane protein YfcA